MGDEVDGRGTLPRQRRRPPLPTRCFTRGYAAAAAPPPARGVLSDPAKSSLISTSQDVGATCSTARATRTRRPRRLSAAKVAIDQYFSKKMPARER